ncbi:MAG: hypothetical protein ACE149_14300 [Armatimonadota bacterium]
MRSTELTPARQQLLQTCRELGFGFIRNLRVVAGEPVLPSPSSIVRDIVFGKQNGPREAEPCDDFALKAQVVELFSYLDQLGDGVIELLVVKHGLPFQMQVAVAA